MKRFLFTLLWLGVAMPFFAQTITYTALSGQFTSTSKVGYLIKPTGASRVELSITITNNSIPAASNAALNFYDGESTSANLTYSLPSMAIGGPYTITTYASSSILIYNSNSSALVPFTVTYKAITNQWLTSGADVVYNNGNVGIGSLTPNFPFTVEKQKGNTNAKFGASSSVYVISSAPHIGFNAYYDGGFKFGKTATVGYGSLLGFDPTGGSMFIKSSTAPGADGAAISAVQTFTFTKDGKLGIGTPTPGALLDVYGSSIPYMRLSSATSGYLEFGVATCNGCFALSAVPGDAVIRKLGGTNNIHLVIPSDNASSVISIGDDTNGGRRTFNVYGSGQVTIGTRTADATAILTVKGKIVASEIQVKDIASIPDYVFKPGYKLMPLHEVELFVKTNSHLPEVPSETEFKANGMNLTEMNALLLKKVEELTLYMIEMKKENEVMKKEIEGLKGK